MSMKERFFGWRRGDRANAEATENIAVENQSHSEEKKAGTEVVFVAPSYDSITEAMVSWLQELARQVGGSTRCLFGQDASANQIAAVLNSADGKKRIIVFYGHGVRDAILTAPNLGHQSSQFKGRHSRLCEAADFTGRGPIAFVGYCCHAATGFGNQLTSVAPPSKYLGYVDELHFYLGNNAREEAFKRPMRTVIANLILTGTLDMTARNQLAQEYENEMAEWTYGHEDDDRRMMIQMFLDWNKRSILLRT